MIEFTPIKKVIPSWPEDAFTLPSALDRIGLGYMTVDFCSGTSLMCSGTIVILDEIECNLPMIPGISLAICAEDEVTEIPFSLELSGTEFDLTLTDLSASLRIDTALLKRVEGNPGSWTESADPVEIEISGAAVSVNESGEVDFSFAEGAPGLSMPKFMIGDSGVVIEVEGLQLLMSDNAASTSLPDGIDSTWRGVYIENATVYLPEDLSDILPDDITLENFFIGSGGFCGTITGNWTDTDGNSTQPDKTFAGMTFRLKSISLEFKQNTIVDSSICGKLTLPFFDGPVEVEIGITNKGGFTVSLASADADGLVTIEKENLFTLTLNSLSVAKEGSTWYVTLGGELNFAIAVGEQSLPVLTIDGLKISSDGKISVTGGGISLGQQTTIKLLDAFTMEIDAVGFGTDCIDAVDMNYISFSGGIQLNEALPAGISTKGLQVLWDPQEEEPTRVRGEGIGINFVIKDVLSFSGQVELQESYFAGSAKISIESADLALDVGVVIGQADGPSGETFKYLGLIVDTQLPVGIPLASTGLAFYGFGGLFAMNMIPRQESYTYSAHNPIFAINNGEIETVSGSLSYADASDGFNWYADWYKDWNQPWTPEAGGIGLGTNTTIGTLADNGFTFAANVAFVFAYPGPILMLQGKGNLLRDRSKLTNTETYPPLFDALIIFDGGAASILAALGMQYEIPADKVGPVSAGAILDAGGSSEAFFDFNNPSNWHVYLGEKEEEKRIRAKVFSLFEADSYLMLDAGSLQAGASIGIDKTYDFKVGSVELAAWISGGGAISWSPQHLQGEMEFGGELSLDIAGIGISLSAEADIAAQTPTPKEIEIDLTVTMDLPWPFDSIEIDIEMAWKDTNAPAAISPLLANVSVAGYKTTDSWPLTITAAANDSFNGTIVCDSDGTAIDIPVIDLDARPVLTFNRPMNDTSGVATNPLAGQKDKISADYTFSYSLTGIALAKWNEDTQKWEELSDLSAYWQATNENAGTQLELYGDGPFSFCRHNISMATGNPALSPPWTPYTDSFLAGLNPLKWPVDMTPTAVDFSEMALRTAYGPSFIYEGLNFTTYERKASATSITTTFTFSDFSTYPGGGICLPINGDPVRVVQIDFGGKAHVAEITFVAVSPGSKAKLVAVYADGRREKQLLSLVVGRAETYRPDPALFKGAVSLEIYGDGAYLESFSYLSMQQLDSVEKMGADASGLIAQRFAFEPNACYRITAVTETALNGTADPAVTRYAFFKTEGPPGDLTPYVSRAVPEERTLLFRGYDITLECNENYVESMYDSLDFSVVDENGAAVKNDEGTEVAFASTDFQPGGAALAYTIAVWLGTLRDMGAAVPDTSTAKGNDIFYATLENREENALPPDKTLDAVWKYNGLAVFSHRFRTSKYVGFRELIASVDPNTVWTMKTTSTDISPLVALATVGGKGEDFENSWYDTLGFAMKDLPGRLEISKVAKTDGTIIALYIEFPETVDWRRISLAITDESSNDVPFSAVRSYDGARVLLLRTGSPSEPGSWFGQYSLNFRFDLDIGSDYPVLYRYGVSFTETADPVVVSVN